MRHNTQRNSGRIGVCPIIYGIHKKLSGDKEELRIEYEPDVEIEEFEKKLKMNQDRDIKSKITSVGPHRDDFCFLSQGKDLRKFGSQGQQRTASLSLKLSEIELVKKITGKVPSSWFSLFGL